MLDYYTQQHHEQQQVDMMDDEVFSLTDVESITSKDFEDYDHNDDDDMSLDLADILLDYKDPMFDDVIVQDENVVVDPININCNKQILNESQHTVTTYASSSDSYNNNMMDSTTSSSSSLEEIQQRLNKCMKRTEYSRALIRQIPTTTTTTQFFEQDEELQYNHHHRATTTKKDSPLQNFLRSGGRQALSALVGTNNNNSYSEGFKTITLSYASNHETSSSSSTVSPGITLERLDLSKQARTGLVLLRKKKKSTTSHVAINKEDGGSRSSSFTRRSSSCPGLKQFVEQLQQQQM